MAVNYIVNGNLPKEAIDKLSDFGNVVLFSTSGITYPQVSNHPDLFFCAGTRKWVVARNTPAEYIQKLKSLEVEYVLGSTPVGSVYPKSACYNAVVTDKYFIHKFSVSDAVLKKTYGHLNPVSIPQGYARCNLLPLKNNGFITSDKGIQKVLIEQNMDVLYVDSSQVLLPGFEHGFFGGCAGVYRDMVFLSGSLKYLNDGERVKNYLRKLNYQVIELYDGPLFDGGSILIC